MTAELVESLIKMAGAEVADAAGERWTAYVRQIRPRGTDIPAPEGYGTSSRYLYIGPASRPVNVGDRIETHCGALRAERVKSVGLGGGICYRWAEMTPA